MNYLIIGIGGFAGSTARYQLGKLLSRRSRSSFPIGTFIVNILGAFLLGIVSSLSLQENLYFLLGDGFLGAFTTFSTFMYEGFHLFQENEKRNAIAYFLITVILGIISYIAGTYIISKFY